MADDLLDLLPRDMFDLSRARAVVARGYPAVSDLLPSLFEWVQDYNWPVAQVIAPFLATVGRPLLPHARRVLAGTDEVWKYWTVTAVVAHFTPDVAEELRPDLLRLSSAPTPAEAAEDVDQAAAQVLARLDGRR